MARGGGGGKRRTYTRDANGRFASTPGGGLAAARKTARPTSGRKGTLAARTSLKRSRSKLAAKDPADPSIRNNLSTRALKGAVTRGNKSLKAVKVSSREKLTVGRVAGTIGKPKKLKPAAKIINNNEKAIGKTKPASTSQAIFSAKSKRPKSMNQRAKALIAAHKVGIANYETKNWADKQDRQPSKQKRDKRKKEVLATLNKLSAQDQIKIAKTYVKQTKQQRQQQAELNIKQNQANRYYAQVAAQDAQRRARSSKAREKGQKFVQNAEKIYNDQSKPVNLRKLANAVRKGIMRPVNKGGKLIFAKTEKTDPQIYERAKAEVRMLKGVFENTKKLRQRKEISTAATAGLKQGRQAIKAKNASLRGVGKKQRLPKAVTKRLPRIKNTGRGDVRQVGLTAYQRMLQQQSRTRTRNISRSNRKLKPVRVSTRTKLKRPAAPR